MQTIDAITSLAYSKGNMGAMRFIVELTNVEQKKRHTIYRKLEECTSIRGTNIWVLFSDLCGQNFDKVYELCENCPNDVLEDACSRQYYSGRKLVAEYLPKTDEQV